MPSCWACQRKVYSFFSGGFGSGMRCRHRASAACLFSCLRLGCCADFFPPKLPIFRRNSFTGVVAVVVIVVIVFAHQVRIPFHFRQSVLQEMPGWPFLRSRLSDFKLAGWALGVVLG